VNGAAGFSLEGRTALVSGGGRGLGRAMAQGLAAAGAHVVVSARSTEQLDATVQAVTAAGGMCLAIPADLGREDSPGELVERVVDRVGTLDILLHAAGNQIRKPALEMTVADWDAIHHVHLRAGFLLAQATARHLVDRKAGGSILFIGSLTSFRGIPDISPYVVVKTAILGLTRSLAVEWAPYGIRVNAIAPGFFATEMTRDLADHPGRRALIDRAPMSRQGEPAELTGAAVFLSSPAASFVTGQSLTVDGGWCAA